MGLELTPEQAYWLPSLNAVRLPEGVDDSTVIDRLRSEYDIEIAPGLGALAGDILRIDCMGYSAQPRIILALVVGLGDPLDAEGADVDPAAGIASSGNPQGRSALHVG